MTYKEISGIDSELWGKMGELFNSNLSPENKNVMAFGMVPVVAFDPFLEMLLKLVAERIGVPLAALKPEIKKDIEHNVVRGIYATAKMVV